MVITEDPIIYFVECKSNKYGLTMAEKVRLRHYAAKYNIVPVLAYPKYSVYSKKEDNIILKELKCNA